MNKKMKQWILINFLIVAVISLISCSQKIKEDNIEQEFQKTTKLTVIENNTPINHILKSINRITKKSTEVDVENEYGAGDCFGIYKKHKPVNDTILLIDNFDCGDYGFTNMTYLVKGEKPLITRKIKKEWMMTDSIPYFVQEWLYDFSDSTTYFYRENRTNKYKERNIPELILFDTIRNELGNEFKIDFEKTIAREYAELFE